MRALNETDVACEIARLSSRPVLYLSWVLVGEWEGAAPYLEPHMTSQIENECRVVIVCANEAEQQELFGLTVGDDGPTVANPYTGPNRVYAVTIDAFGELCDENT